ncbi:MAG: septum formation protein Maf [Rhizobacter sp.]|nr:septum formation protein Maf [Bacteriovorax sp.]
MESGKFTLVLGSQSPRRKQLLSWINIPFQILTADLDEVSTETDSEKIAVDIASQKAHAVLKKAGDIKKPFIISSDTIVVLNNVLYAKPADKEDARRILNELAGHTHEVITGVSFLFHDDNNRLREHTFYDSTEVTFTDIPKELMDSYIETGDSLDKAGAYGIQGPSLTFISKLNGSYSNVVGFPIDKILSELAIILGDDWRKTF